MKLGIETRYYTPHVHKGAFYVPAYVEKLLSDVEPEGYYKRNWQW